MANFILIFVCLGLGILLKKSGKFHEKSHTVLNAFVIYVSLPAMVLVQIPALLRTSELSFATLIPVSMAWILFLLSFFTFRWFGQKKGWSRAETGALILTAGLGNTSFVGFPLLESLMIDSSAIRIGILVDQLGTFLVLSTLGLVVASAMSPAQGRIVHPKAVMKSVFTFPPFASLIVALIWYWTGTSNAPVLASVFERLAATLVPLALVAVGFQLRVSPEVLKRQKMPLFYGLGFKLLVAPLFFLILYEVIFRARGFTSHVTILESAMAPMITASVVAEEFGFNAEIASLMVGVGIPISLATVSIWHVLLTWISF